MSMAKCLFFKSQNLKPAEINQPTDWRLHLSCAAVNLVLTVRPEYCKDKSAHELLTVQCQESFSATVTLAHELKIDVCGLVEPDFVIFLSSKIKNKASEILPTPGLDPESEYLINQINDLCDLVKLYMTELRNIEG